MSDFNENNKRVRFDNMAPLNMAPLNMEPNNNTYIVTLVDKSGSMASQGDAPAKRLSGFITDQKGDVFADVWTFSAHNTCKKIICMKPSSEVNISQEDMYPDGSTAFWSSCCTVIDDMVQNIKNMTTIPNAIILVLYTDGMENDSRDEYMGENGKNITKNKIELLQTKYNAIVYLLGANINSKEVGGSIGILPSYCIDYHHSANGCTNVFRSASDAVTRLRSVNKNEDRLYAAGFNDMERISSIACPNNTYSPSQLRRTYN